MWENVYRKNKFLNGYRKQAEFVREFMLYTTVVQLL